MSQIITAHCTAPKTVGIGEIGLDYYYSIDHMHDQKELFELQLDIAHRKRMPINVHSRDAEQDTVAILKNYPGLRGAIHCFSGSREFAFQALDLGFYISVSGVVTFPKNTQLQEIIKNLPLDRLLMETDAPFLAPLPFRGKINEPSYIVHIAQKIAELFEIPVEEIAEKTNDNFFNLFGIGQAI
jgi:TatD DNase family protein